MKIQRQHETTTIDELEGTTCKELKGVGSIKNNCFHFWYLRANDIWYRFFLQHSILFWDTSAPDPEDDLSDNEDYHDLLAQIGPPGSRVIGTIKMSDDILTITFTDGPALVFSESQDTGCTSVAVKWPTD